MAGKGYRTLGVRVEPQSPLHRRMTKKREVRAIVHDVFEKLSDELQLIPCSLHMYPVVLLTWESLGRLAHTKIVRGGIFILRKHGCVAASGLLHLHTTIVYHHLSS